MTRQVAHLRSVSDRGTDAEQIRGSWTSGKKRLQTDFRAVEPGFPVALWSTSGLWPAA